MQIILGVKSLPTACLQTMILMETAFMEQIYLLIRDTDMKVLEACYTVQGSLLRVTSDSLYGADISTHPRYRHEGIGSMLYGARISPLGLL